MNPFKSRLRAATALAAVAALAPFAGAPAASAAPADTSTYTSAQYLQSALGLPAKSKLVIESVTYDRFQWLLQQEGRFAFLIGDPATDPTFASRAQDVEDAAETAGVKSVYWFNPNLSGNAKVGSTTEPDLDIRNPAGITEIAAASQTVYGTAWQSLVARYLGNGIKDTQVNPAYTGSAKITTSFDNTVVNDAGATAGLSTKLGNANGGALYDYSSGSAPANVQDSYFFLYDKDNTVTPPGSSTPVPAKIYSWVNLTKQASSASARADVAAAIATCGAANIKSIDEFTWWKTANNKWQSTSSPNDYQGANVPNLSDADGDAAKGGWRVHQVTYPELVFILKTEKTKDVAFLFGGTWCPNTRPVLPSINKYARENDVTVINWDTILDGSVNGGGNSSANPLQSRGPVATGSGATLVPNANPSFIYGDLVTQYLSNLKTEYKADGGNKITFYPGGDQSKAVSSQPRLQVPYLFGYKGKGGGDAHGGITRQWIIDKGNGDFTEYMSVWHFTNPQPNQLGVTPANLPREAPIWSKINSDLAKFTWQTDVESLKANTAIDTDDAQFLADADTGRVVSFTAPDTVTVATGGAGAFSINAAALQAALAGLTPAPANYAAARADYITAKTANTDPTRIANLETVVVAWGVAQQRKNRVNSIWGTAVTPSSVAGGIAAVHAIDVFFSGLPRKAETPAPTPTPTAPVAETPKPAANTPQGTTTVIKAKAGKIAGKASKVPTSKKPGKYTVTITAATGKAAATGKVTVKLKKGKKSKTLTGTVKNGVVTITLPKLAKGTWKVTITWAGDANYLAAPAQAGTSIKVKK